MAAQEVLERRGSIVGEYIQNATGVLHFPHRNVVIDCYGRDSMQRAVEALLEGKVIGMNICGVQGLIVDGSNPEALDKVFVLKRRDKSSSLVIGAGESTRSWLVDQERIPKRMKALGSQVYDLPNFLELPIREDIHELIGKQHDELGRVGAILWANLYHPLNALEQMLQMYSNESFLAGSSANISGQPSLETAQDVYRTFKDYTGRILRFNGTSGSLAYILQDERFEREPPFTGSHVIFGYQNGRLYPLRPGAITLDSYKYIYGSILNIPKDWQEKPTAKFVNVDLVRAKRTYFTDQSHS